MNNIREALEEILDILGDAHGYYGCDIEDDERCTTYGGTGEACFACRCQRIARKAIESTDQWRTPDVNTPDKALVWYRFGNQAWRPALSRDIKPCPDLYEFVLAKENQGPPPDDWMPSSEE